MYFTILQKKEEIFFTTISDNVPSNDGEFAAVHTIA